MLILPKTTVFLNKHFVRIQVHVANAFQYNLTGSELVQFLTQGQIFLNTHSQVVMLQGKSDFCLSVKAMPYSTYEHSKANLK